jgi:hypothetical protein
VRESQESIVLLDRTHTLKVQQIQKEYQDFMERIRNKAQVRPRNCGTIWGLTQCCGRKLAASICSAMPMQRCDHGWTYATAIQLERNVVAKTSVSACLCNAADLR